MPVLSVETQCGLKAHCPNGVDVYFDNVGGDILDAALARLNRKARVVICGAISQYNNTSPNSGPKNYMSLLINRARMEGMVVFDYVERFPQAVAELAGYLKDGRIKSKEDIVRGGVAAFPATLLKLFSGANFGKLVRTSPDNTAPAAASPAGTVPSGSAAPIGGGRIDGRC